MSSRETVRGNKTSIVSSLCGDYTLILNKAEEKNLITKREYVNLKNINKANVEEHVVELVDKILNKGEKTCESFLKLLQTDEDIKTTFPDLEQILNKDLPEPVQVSRTYDAQLKGSQQQKKEPYQLKSQPVGLCVIINNKNFMDGSERRGTDQDAQSLAEVFSWLGFRVLMCTDQTRDQMAQTLTWFASLRDHDQLQGMGIQEWRGNSFTAPQQGVRHGDAFICCILSHGRKGVVLGIDHKLLSIKEIRRTFKATEQSALTGKPKVFFIQACQGPEIQRGVLEKDDCDPQHIPEEADILVAMATVEDHAAIRHTMDGSWFVQSLCQLLKECCPRGEDLTTILQHVNDEVSRREGSSQPGKVKQMPEVTLTLRRRLVLSPHHT